MGRGLKRLAIGLLGLVLVCCLGVYAWSEWLIRAPDPGMSFHAPPRGDAVEGARLAKITGCRGCHRDDLSGDVFLAEPYVFRLVAPNLTQARAKYNDDALARLLRTGAKVNGMIALGMPQEQQQRLDDRELADIIAFLRTAPAVAGRALPSTRLYLPARLGVVLGVYPVHGEDAPESAAVLADRGASDRGRHLAAIACVECHGTRLEGGPEMGAPPLLVAKAYPLDKFTRLMRTGITLSGKESASGLMTGVARGRFVALSDAEIADLHRYLQSR